MNLIALDVYNLKTCHHVFNQYPFPVRVHNVEMINMTAN